MARKSKTIPEGTKIWAIFLQIRIEVLCNALNALFVSKEMLNDENDISKALCPQITTASRNHKEKLEPPAYESKNKAQTEIDLLSPSIETRPDFTYTFIDETAMTNEEYEIPLHIECKRIGSNNPAWNLNKNYVNNGIMRFDLLSHEYGRRAHDGIMIGYIVSSTKSEIQNDINKNMPSNIGQLCFQNNNKVELVTTKFNRKVVVPYDFNLYHIWADFTKTS